MKRLLLIASVAALCGALPAIVLAQMTTAPSHVTISLESQNDSGETGTATLQQSGNDLLVTLRVNNPTAAIQPVHIHKGTCAKLDPKPEYPLPPVTDRRSTTKIKNLTLASLLATPHAINIHKSPKEAAIYVSCGNIKT